MTVFQDHIVFSAEDIAAQNNEPWISDGTTTGTKMLRDLVVPFNSYPREFTEANGLLFFSAGDQLWTTDGTTQGTKAVRIKEVDRAFIVGLTALKNNVYFGMSDADGDMELWSSDGTTEGTTKVREINPSGSSTDEIVTISGSPRTISLGAKLYFVANDGVHGYDIWGSDGTAEGTYLVADINKNEAPGELGANFKALDKLLFFTANDGELWRIDTQKDEPLRLVSGGVRTLLAAFDRRLFFTTKDNDLWTTDGTPQGTQLFIGDIAPTDCIVFRENMICADGGNLWKTDGTPSGSGIIAAIQPNPFVTAAIFGFTPLGSELYFFADDGNGPNLWKTNGSSTEKILNPLATQSPTFPPEATSMVAFDSALFFNADYDESGSELWQYAPAGVTPVDEKMPGKFRLYPNPARDQVHIDLGQAVPLIRFSIFNLSGELLLQEDQSNLIDIRSIPAGLYYVRITDGESQYFRKLVVNK